MNNELLKINDQIQNGEIVKSEDINKLWNFYNKEFNKICFVVCWNNGLKYKTKIFNSIELERGVRK
jgi:hypothetical protein